MPPVLRLRNAGRNGPAGAAGAVVCFGDDLATALLLGASSVFAPAGARPGDALVDTNTGQAVATLLDWTGLAVGEGFPNPANAALAKPLADVSSLARIPFAPTRPVAGTALAGPAGSGTVVDPWRDCVMRWDDPASGAIFRFGLADQVLCAPLHGEGDDGAPVFAPGGALAGIVAARPAIEAAMGLPGTAVTPMDAIARHRAWGGRRLLPFGLPAPSPPGSVPRPAAGRDLDTLARTMWGEARGEGHGDAAARALGLGAVAWVVRNRVAADRPRSWGATVDAVCRKPWQFSCWNPGDPNLPKLRAVTAADPVFSEALGVGRSVLDNTVPDPTGGATHYHARGVSPSWAAGRQPSAVIGTHLFYAGVP